MFRCADAPIMLVVGNDPQFARLAAELGVPELAADPRFSNNTSRVRNRAALNAIIEPIFRSRPKRHWIDALGRQGVPCGPVNELHEVFEEPQVRAREMVVTMPHPRRGELPLLANPIRLSGTPVQYRMRPPALGEHTDEVLREVLGCDETRIAALRDAGIV
jgi:crotonobetainyl-CoA:carnitine CoA-transferase CaiB-like acyl-CoA transferase